MASSTSTPTPSSTSQAFPRVCSFERVNEQFYQSTIAEADSIQGAAGRMMRDLNQIHEIVAGLGAVLRIVGGSQVVQDQFEPDNPTSAPPLCRTTEYLLTAMAAALCERMRDDIEITAEIFNARVQA